MRARCGFTLLELMVTLTVVAILAAITLPSFRPTIQRYRLNNARDDLQAALQYARSEAIMRATYVSVCSSTDGASCAATNTYETGWIVYAHPVLTTKATDVYSAASASAMQILRVQGAVQDVSLRALDIAVVTFGQQGQLEPLASRTNAAQPMAFVACAIPARGGSPGSNTTALPGSRIGISPYGGIAVTPLATTDGCTP